MVASEVKRVDYLTSLVNFLSKAGNLRGTIEEFTPLRDLYGLMLIINSNDLITITESGFPSMSEVNSVLHYLKRDTAAVKLGDSNLASKMREDVSLQFGEDINKERPEFDDGISNFGFVSYDARFNSEPLWIKYQVTVDEIPEGIELGNFGIDDLRIVDVVLKNKPDAEFLRRVDVIGPFDPVDQRLNYRTFVGKEKLLCKRSVLLCGKDSIDDYIKNTDYSEVYTL